MFDYADDACMICGAPMELEDILNHKLVEYEDKPGDIDAVMIIKAGRRAAYAEILDMIQDDEEGDSDGEG